jgi:Protein of unknown function (DUF3186).
LISFRYHIVSIIAVFLALALGIVVGTTALNGPITTDLRHQVNDAKKQRDQLAQQVKQLQGQVSDAGQFASTYGTQLVAGTLSGKNVLEILLPGAPSAMQEGLERQIAASGGKISGRVTVTSGYLDPSRGTGIISLATGSAHPTGWNAPPTSDAGKLGGSLLSYVLLGKGQATDLTQVLGGFVQLHMIDLNGANVTPSTLVVVLAHGNLANQQYAGSAEMSLVSALAQDKGQVVVAGDAASATGSGLLSLVRGSSTDRNALSTVDNADTPFGQVATILALAGASKGQLGQYGTQNGADALFPAPAR